MSAIAHAVNGFRARARAGRAHVFRSRFRLGPGSKVLDIGSEDGSSIAAVLQGAGIAPGNVYIADIDVESVERGRRLFGFTPVVIPESGRLPFDDGFFDVVYCSSVIEHVTLPKTAVWTLRSGREFRRIADERQAEFASEIRRLGRGYFVQTPNRWFPIESHTWLPFVGYLPRRLLVPLLGVTNRVWVKRTSPDWRLLSIAEMRRLFPEARIVRERVWGMTKSIMAIKGLT
ncbi:methyltransferase [Sulfurifustis variabilis]|uniref:Methyltransferase n=1 Tax=Sulfurifustis variabilis TaxID=1675686 RepID=A0A1B4VBM4_9GAMM|nr:methyltransferase domain-containing protein [Sulfurifustis variabilis]BAU48111.1 methyltransferase [Sulfurifustis variabilis]